MSVAKCSKCSKVARTVPVWEMLTVQPDKPDLTGRLTNDVQRACAWVPRPLPPVTSGALGGRRPRRAGGAQRRSGRGAEGARV